MSRMPQALVFLFLALVSTYQADLIGGEYCPRCVRIEAERAKEQAENPQPIRYYDEWLSLHQPANEGSIAKTDSPPATSSEGSGKLSGSTFRTATQGDKSSATPSEQRESPSQKREALRKEQTRLLSQSSLIEQTTLEHLLAVNVAAISPTEDFFEEDGADGAHPSTKVGQKMHKDKSKQSTYSTLYTIFKTRDFLETLDGSFTLLLPTNEALMQLPPGTLESLAKPENAEKLAQLVSNHVIPKKILRDDFQKYNGKEVKTLSGRNLTLKDDHGNLSIDNVHIYLMEASGYDGVIYLIDQVLQ